MDSGLSNTRRVARNAARRMLARSMIDLGGRGLCLGLGLAVPAVVAARWANWGSVEVSSLAAGLAVVGATLGMVAAIWRRPTLLQGAMLLDQRGGLRDRLASALAFEESQAAASFTPLVLNDAERIARGVYPERLVPIRDAFAARWWGLAPAIMAIVLLSALLVPNTPPWKAGSTRGAEPTAEVIATLAELKRAASPGVPEMGSAHAGKIEEIERELLAGHISDEEARARAAAATRELADAVERRAESDAGEADALRERLAGAAREAARAPGPLGTLLREGKLDAAAGEIDRLRQQLDGATPEERRRLAEDLERIANALREDPKNTPQEDSAAQTDAGERTPEESPPVGQGPEPDPEGAQRGDGRSATGKGGDAEELADALEDAAKELRQHAAEGEGARNAETEAGSRVQDQSGRDEASRSPSPEGAPPRSQPTPPAETPDSKQAPDQPGQPTGGRPKGDRAAEAPGDKPDASAPQAPDPAGKPKPGENAPSKPASDATGRSADNAAPDGAREVTPPAAEGDGLRRVERALRDAAERQESARQRLRESQDLRRQAREVLEGRRGETDEQRRGAAEREQPGASGSEPRLAGERAPEAGDRPGFHRDAPPDHALPNGGPTETLRVDAEGERAIGEWMGDRPDEAPGRREAARDGLRRAADGAERAIEQQRVPAEYRDLVRRVFRRYIDHATEARPAGAVPR